MMSGATLPIACFGYGCDFAGDNSILDWKSKFSMFGPPSTVNVVNQGESGSFNRCSFFFREGRWAVDEMVESMYEVASRAIDHYLARYGESAFRC